MTYPHDLEKAALRGEPSYIWRDGQQRRLEMIVSAAGERIHGMVLEDGCGVGQYMHHLAPLAGKVTGLDFDFERVKDTARPRIGCGQCRRRVPPLSTDSFDLVISNEVIEHVMA